MSLKSHTMAHRICQTLIDLRFKKIMSVLFRKTVYNVFQIG